ncbi:MAG: type II secretion system protein GspN, partial [Spirochaetota bacterium]
LTYSSETINAGCRINNGISELVLDTVQGLPKSGTFKFGISDLFFKGITIPIIGPVPAIKNGTIKTSLSFSPRLMTIQECTISGKDLSGSLRGTIALDANIMRSQLNLTFEIDPRSGVIENLEPFAKELIKSRVNSSTGKIPVSVTGSLSDPSIAPYNPNAPEPPAPPFPPMKR